MKALLTCAFCAISVAAVAQTSIPDSESLSPPSFSQSAPSISDQKLDKAAAALERIASLERDFRQQVAKAVTDQGLSMDEYTQIIDVAQNDPQVRQKIISRIKPLKDETGSENK